MKNIIFFMWLIVPVFLYAQTNPVPHKLANSPYKFNGWSEDSPARTYPSSIMFHTCKKQDPKITDEMTGDWISSYNLKSKARINGLGDLGFSFLTTSSAQEGDAYPGAAVLSLDTRGCQDVYLQWIARTIKANDRNYSIYLQYRIDTNSKFTNLANIVYNASKNDGDYKEFREIRLPPECSNLPFMQIRWKYCYENDGSSGGRPQLAVDDIIISTNINDSVYEITNDLKFIRAGNLLQILNAGGCELKCINVIGEVIFQRIVDKDLYELQLDNFLKGLYFITLQKDFYFKFEKVLID